MSRTKGVNLIKKNVGKFQSIISGLEKGIKLCEEGVNSNSIKIKELTDENNMIEESKLIASTFKDNLNVMLTVPNSDKVSSKTKEE